jgi:hypothetical protein
MIQTIGVVILIFLFLFVVVVFNTRSTENNLLTGFWKGSDDFTKQAGIDLFLVYIGGGSTMSCVRPGYILIKNNEGLIINNPVEFTFSCGKSINPRMCSCREYIINIDWLGEDSYDFFPSEQELYYYPCNGKLVFSSEDQIHAILYKDNNISDISSDTMPNLNRIDNEDAEDI